MTRHRSMAAIGIAIVGSIGMTWKLWPAGPDARFIGTWKAEFPSDESWRPTVSFHRDGSAEIKGQTRGREIIGTWIWWVEGDQLVTRMYFSTDPLNYAAEIAHDFISKLLGRRAGQFYEVRRLIARCESDEIEAQGDRDRMILHRVKE